MFCNLVFCQVFFYGLGIFASFSACFDDVCHTKVGLVAYSGVGTHGRTCLHRNTGKTANRAFAGNDLYAGFAERCPELLG